VCIRCSGIHRNLGVHISKVKSVSLDAWPLDLAEHIQELGNDAVNAVYEATLPAGRKPTEDTGNYEVENLIRDKYVNKKYYRDPSSKPKKKKSHKKASQESSSSGSESEDEKPRRGKGKPKRRESGDEDAPRKSKSHDKPKKRADSEEDSSDKPVGKPKKPRSKKGGKSHTSKEKSSEDSSSGTIKPPSQQSAPERKQEKAASSGIFGDDFNTQFTALQVSSKDEGFDAKFADFTDFQSSQKSSMAKSSDIENFFTDAAAKPGATTAAAPASSSSFAGGGGAFDVQEVPANKPAKDAAKGIMALFGQQPQQARGGYGGGGYDMSGYGGAPQMQAAYGGYPGGAYPAVGMGGVNAYGGAPAAAAAYPMMPGYPAAAGAGYPAMGGGRASQYAMWPNQQPAAAAYPMAQPQQMGFGGLGAANSMNFAVRQQQPAQASQSSAFDGLF